MINDERHWFPLERQKSGANIKQKNVCDYLCVLVLLKIGAITMIHHDTKK